MVFYISIKKLSFVIIALLYLSLYGVKRPTDTRRSFVDFHSGGNREQGLPSTIEQRRPSRERRQATRNIRPVASDWANKKQYITALGFLAGMGTSIGVIALSDQDYLTKLLAGSTAFFGTFSAYKMYSKYAVSKKDATWYWGSWMVGIWSTLALTGCTNFILKTNNK